MRGMIYAGSSRSMSLSCQASVMPSREADHNLQ
jgi:hypothetical protein